MRNKILILFSVFVILFSLGLTGCGKYTSSYSATLLIKSNDSDSGFMNFYSFKGRNVMKFKAPKNKKSTLYYKASLGDGTATIYYDDDGTKKELFTIKGGESFEDTYGEFEDITLYVIYETDGKCKDGKIDFELKEI